MPSGLAGTSLQPIRATIERLTTESGLKSLLFTPENARGDEEAGLHGFVSFPFSFFLNFCEDLLAVNWAMSSLVG